MNEFTKTNINENIQKSTNKPLYLLVATDPENKSGFNYYYGTQLEILASHVKLIGFEIPQRLVKEAKNITNIAAAEKLGLDPVSIYVGWQNICKLQTLSYKKAATTNQSNVVVQ